MIWASSLQVVWLLLLAGVNLSLAVRSLNGWIKLIAAPGKPNIPFLVEYDTLNEILADNTKNNDVPAKFFAVIRRLLDEGCEKLNPKVHNRLRQIDPKAIEQFLALEDVYLRPQCDMNSYQVIRNNEISTGTRLAVPTLLIVSMRAIEQVIRDVALEHANQCHLIYPKQFSTLRKKIRRNPDEKPHLTALFKLMSTFVSASKTTILYPERIRKDPADMIREKLANFKVSGKTETEAILDYLTYVTRSNPGEAIFLGVISDRKQRNTRHVDDSKVSELLHNYIFSRCHFLDEKAGHILTPAAYEQNIFDLNNRYKATTKSHSFLIQYLVYHRVCKQILDSKKIIERNVISAILERDRREIEIKMKMKEREAQNIGHDN